MRVISSLIDIQILSVSIDIENVFMEIEIGVLSMSIETEAVSSLIDIQILSVEIESGVISAFDRNWSSIILDRYPNSISGNRKWSYISV